MTVEGLAEQLGLNPVDLRRWEENGTIPAEAQTRLAARFGVDVSWLTGAESLPSDVIRRDRARRRFEAPGPVRRNRLAALRAGEGLSQPVLARELKVDREELAGWEQGAPIPEKYERVLAARFGVTVDWLTGRESLDSEIIPAAPDERG